MVGEDMRDESRGEDREEPGGGAPEGETAAAGGPDEEQEGAVHDERASAGRETAGAGPEEPAGEKAGEKAEKKVEENVEKKVEKRVDEGWKAEAKREKEALDRKIKEKLRKEVEARQPPPADFLHFVSGIAAQVLMQLGDIENPIAGKKVIDLSAARYSIDILQMLEDKTKGNLTPDETRYLTAALHDLRMRFVAAATAGEKPGGEAAAKTS